MLSAGIMSAQSSVKVEVQNIVSLDEQFHVTFVVEGKDPPSSFSWNPGQDFNLVWGPQKGSTSSMNIVNGKTTSSSKFTYTYILTAKAAGKFTIPSASAVVKGATISSNPVMVEVISGGSKPKSRSGSESEVSGNELFMRMTLSKTNVVVGEPLTATLKLYTNTNLTGFEGAEFPSFEGFWSQAEVPSDYDFKREVVDGKIYESAVIRRFVLIPQKSGQLTIDPAELMCLVSVKVQSRSNSVFDDFFGESVRNVRKRVVAPGMKVNVRPLPAGEPTSYGGGVGSFKIDSRLSKDSLKTHDAAALVITVSGTGNLSLLSAPQVRFPADFESYDSKTSLNATAGGTSGTKTFEYPFIPRSHGDFEIPEIEYSYYDVNAGRYVTTKTGPIKVHVAKGKVSESSAAVPSISSPDRRDVRNLGEDIRYIKTSRPSLDKGDGFLLGKAGYWIFLAFLFIAAAVVWAATRKIVARRADVVGTRNRGATRKARKRLKLAEEHLGKNLYSAFYEELHRALLGFISDKMNMKVEDLNKEMISARLTENGVDPALAGEFTDLLDACEFARYSPASGNEAMKSHYDAAVKVISSIDYKMKGKKSSVTTAMIIVMALMLPGFSAVASETADAAWENGTAAYQEGRWKDAADAWEGIVSEGVESAELYYNIGNAWFKHGDMPKAILYYEKALKLNPSDDDVRFNLEFARGQIQDRIDEVPEFVLTSWGRKLCYKLSSNTWAVLFLLFISCALAMLLFFLLSSGRGARRGGFLGAIAFALVAAVCLHFACWQYSDYRKSDMAIVMVPVSSVKNSPSAGVESKDLFILHEGTKVRILEEAGSWCNIELADGRRGWMRKSEMEMP